MPTTTPARAPDHAICSVCDRPNGPYSVVVDGITLHDTCVDWSARPFPGAGVGREASKTARRLRKLAASLDLAASAFHRMHRWWPATPVATLRRYHALRARVHRALHDALRGW
jgi:hypothetical protein